MESIQDRNHGGAQEWRRSPEPSSCCPTDSLKELLQMSVNDEGSRHPEEGKALLCRPFKDRNQANQRNSGKPILS